MSDDEPKNKSGRKSVSPVRKVISALVLVVLLGILAIEGRAGFGHSSSIKTLEGISESGVFPVKKFTKEDIEGMLSMSPTSVELIKGKDRTEYRYSWYSMLRPALKGIRDLPDTELYVTYVNTEPAYAMLFGTDKPEQWEIEGKISPAGEQSGIGSDSPPPLEPPPPPAGEGDEDSDESAADEASADDNEDKGEPEPSIDEEPTPDESKEEESSTPDGGSDN